MARKRGLFRLNIYQYIKLTTIRNIFHSSILISIDDLIEALSYKLFLLVQLPGVTAHMASQHGVLECVQRFGSEPHPFKGSYDGRFAVETRFDQPFRDVKGHVTDETCRKTIF